MISITTKDRSGNEYGPFFEPDIELDGFSNGLPGGFLHAIFFYAVDKLDTSAPEVSEFADVKIYDDAELVWQGVIVESRKNRARNGYDVACAGYWSYLAGRKVRRHYCDTLLENWKDLDASTRTNSVNGSRYTTDKLNRLFIGMKKDTWYSSNDRQGFSYAMGSDYLTKLKFSYTSKLTSTFVTTPWHDVKIYAYVSGAWSDIGTLGCTNNVAVDYTYDLPANTQEVRVESVAKTGYTFTFDDNYWYAKFTNVEVYGALQTYGQPIVPLKADNIAKDVLGLVGTEISSDYSNIALDTSETLEIKTVYDDRVPAQQIIVECTDKYANYNLGVWEDQKLHLKKHDAASVTYSVDLDECEDEQAATSVDQLVRSVTVKHHDAAGKTQYVTVTDTDADSILVKKNWDIEADITEDTTSATVATARGQAYLDSHNKIRGSAPITTPVVRSSEGSELKVTSIRSGKNIRIDNYIDENNVFKVVLVNYKHKDGTVDIHLDKKDFSRSELLSASALSASQAVPPAPRVFRALSDVTLGNVSTRPAISTGHDNETHTGLANDPSTTTGLTYGYRAGRIRSDNVVTDVVAGTVALTASATNYVECTPPTGVVTANTTGFTAGRLPMATVVTGVSSITTITDKRVWFNADGVAAHAAAADPHTVYQKESEKGAASGYASLGVGGQIPLSEIPTTLTGKNADQVDGADLDTDGTLAANSDVKVPSQKAVKTYADGLIAANDALQYKGAIDCSTNPIYPAANSGHLYKVSVAGKIGGASGPNVEIGDSLLCTVDGSAAGNHATVGANWNIIQVNIDGAVIGPASVTDNRLAAFDGATGKLLKDSGKVIGDLELIVNKGAASGYAGLDAGTKVPTAQLGGAGADATKFLCGNQTWQVPAGGGPAARAYHNANQSIPNGVVTSLAFNSERFDTDNIHDLITNNSRLTCRTAGKYLIVGNCAFEFNSTGARLVEITKNGSLYLVQVSSNAVTTAGWGTNFSASVIEDMNVNDYVELQVLQTSGVAVNILSMANFTPEFMMIKV